MLIRTRTTNPKCHRCAKQLDGQCTAKTFKDCPLANIQSAYAQFEKLVRGQAGMLPEQVLLVSVLCQPVLDSVHMYKPKGQSNPCEAEQFIRSKTANGLCRICELDHDWFIELSDKFINGVRKAGLKSIGHGRAVKNAEKRKNKGVK